MDQQCKYCLSDATMQVYGEHLCADCGEEVKLEAMADEEDQRQLAQEMGDFDDPVRDEREAFNDRLEMYRREC